MPINEADFDPADPAGLYDVPIADLSTRLAAKTVDWFVSILAWVPGVVILFATLDESEDPHPLGVLLLLAGWLGIAVYQWVLLANDGQTIGKRAMNIHIHHLDGSPPDFIRNVFLREWVINAGIGVLNQCCLGWVLGLLDVLFIFTPRRQCLHDQLANTVVARGTWVELRD